jgi:signal transduction histidine kinase
MLIPIRSFLVRAASHGSSGQPWYHWPQDDTGNCLGNSSHLTEAARHLLELVEDLLNLGQLEAGAAEVRLATTEIAPVIADAVSILEPLALDRHVEVRPELGDGLAASADRRCLRQALLNLIGNAIKFNRTGGSVDIAIASSGDHVLIDVRDTGPGVPDLADELLYRPFERLGHQQTEVPGTGLGLTISKQSSRRWTASCE